MSQLDRGRAYEVLRTDWRDLDPRQRETAFLDALEECIEPDPIPLARSDWLHPSLHNLFAVMQVWLIVGSLFRLIIQISHGQTLDVLPFISITMGTVATIAFLRAPANTDIT